MINPQIAGAKNGKLLQVLGGLGQAAGSIATQAAGKFFPEIAVRAVMSNIKVGCIEVETPDAGFWVLGDPAATERCRLRVKDKALFENLVRFWDIGLGESYQSGHFEVDNLPAFIQIILKNIAHLPGLSGSPAASQEVNREARGNRELHTQRANTRKGSQDNIAYHYDLGNDLYSLFLDPTMAYSSAVYQTRSDTLQQAQIHKFDLLCRKLELKAGDHDQHV